MTVFDYIIEQLLEILRLSIYRYAGRSAPARKLRGRETPAAAEAPRPVQKARARRRSAVPGGLLTWALLLLVGFLFYRRFRLHRR